MSESLGAECAHGSLARSCPRCEDAATIARLTALVRRLEWGGRSWPAGYHFCLACLRLEQDRTHAPGCEIAEVLR